MKALKFFLKALGCASYVFMLFFTGLLALLAICLCVIAIIDGEVIGFAAAFASAFLSALCWSIRKDGMV